MKDIIKLLRFHQYTKNLFVFMPLFFTFTFDNFQSNVSTMVAFILFSMIASSIYVLNDLMDVKEDKRHPTKKDRPIASGKVSPKSAKIIFSILSFSALLLASIFNFQLFIILLIYFILNILYSLRLKHIPIIDLFIISTGFVLRLFAGSVVTDIELSMWIIIITFLLAMFLAFAKRRDDVLLSIKGQETRKNIDGYNLEFVNASMVLMSGVVIMSYILYTVSSDVISRLHTEYLYLTSFFVILGILRYMQITFVEENSGNPTKIVVQDKFMIITILFWLLSFIGIIKFL